MVREGSLEEETVHTEVFMLCVVTLAFSLSRVRTWHSSVGCNFH